MRRAPPAPEKMDICQSPSGHIRQERADGMSLTRILHELDFRPIVAEPKPDEVLRLTTRQANEKRLPHVHLVRVSEDMPTSWHAKKIATPRRRNTADTSR